MMRCCLSLRNCRYLGAIFSIQRVIVILQHYYKLLTAATANAWLQNFRHCYINRLSDWLVVWVDSENCLCWAIGGLVDQNYLPFNLNLNYWFLFCWNILTVFVFFARHWVCLAWLEQSVGRKQFKLLISAQCISRYDNAF